MKHLESDRMRQFAIEAIDFTEAENMHLDDCATCWKQLVVAIQLAVHEAGDSERIPVDHVDSRRMERPRSLHSHPLELDTFRQ